MEDVQVQSINQATADEQSFGLLNFVSSSLAQGADLINIP